MVPLAQAVFMVTGIAVLVLTLCGLAALLLVAIYRIARWVLQGFRW